MQSSIQFSSVTQSCLTLQPHGLQHDRTPCPSPIPGACSNSCPSSPWYHPTISSSVIPFSSCLQSFPASGSSPMNQFFTSGDQSIGVSASVISPSNEYSGLYSFPLGWTDAEAETPILWSPHVKKWLIWKDPDAGKDWRREKKGTTKDEMVGCHHRLNRHEFE